LKSTTWVTEYKKEHQRLHVLLHAPQIFLGVLSINVKIKKKLLTAKTEQVLVLLPGVRLITQVFLILFSSSL